MFDGKRGKGSAAPGKGSRPPAPSSEIHIRPKRFPVASVPVRSYVSSSGDFRAGGARRRKNKGCGVHVASRVQTNSGSHAANAPEKKRSVTAPVAPASDRVSTEVEAGPGERAQTLEAVPSSAMQNAFARVETFPSMDAAVQPSTPIPTTQPIAGAFTQFAPASASVVPSGASSTVQTLSERDPASSSSLPSVQPWTNRIFNGSSENGGLPEVDRDIERRFIEKVSRMNEDGVATDATVQRARETFAAILGAGSVEVRSADFPGTPLVSLPNGPLSLSGAPPPAPDGEVTRLLHATHENAASPSFADALLPGAVGVERAGNQGEASMPHGEQTADRHRMPIIVLVIVACALLIAVAVATAVLLRR